MSSSRTAVRLNRILAMLPWVLANPGATVEEVCTRFDYTRAQLAADLDLVFVCGLPGYGPGDLMVAYIDEEEVVVEMADYFAEAMRLTPREALSLLASAMAVLGSGQPAPALERAVAKLQAVVLPDASQALTIALPEPEFVGELRTAAADGTVVAITYTAIATGATTQRDVEPWSAFTTLGNWYLRGYCRSAQAERVFRIDRIQHVAATDESFTPSVVAPVPVVRYTPGEEDVRAVIRLGTSARWIADYYPVEVLEEDEDALTIRFSASEPAVAARILARLGPDAELIDGDEVAVALADLRQRILGRYVG